MLGEGTRMPLIRLKPIGLALVVGGGLAMIVLGFAIGFLIVSSLVVTPSPAAIQTPEPSAAQASPSATAASRRTPGALGPTRAPVTPTLEPTPASVLATPTPSDDAESVASPESATPIAEPTAAEPTAEPEPPTPTAEPRVVVANTDGQGVFLRGSKSIEDRLQLYPEGTEFVVRGPAEEGEGRQCLPVRASDGTEGWLPVEYSAFVPEPTAEATPVEPAETPEASSPTSSEVAGQPAASALTPPQPIALPSARVVTVVDGDTAEVVLGGQNVQLRFIGIDTPEQEPGQPSGCYSPEAAAKARELLEGKILFLEADPTQGEKDSFGRLLVYAWLPDGRLFNLEMVALGFAFERTDATAYKYQELFRQSAAEAQQQELGLWSPSTCGGNIDATLQEPVAQ